MSKSAKERQQEYRDRLRQSGKRQLLVTVDEDVYQDIKRQAQEQGASVNQVANAALRGAQVDLQPEETMTLEFGWMKAPKAFCNAFEEFYGQVQNARLEGWTKTDISEARRCVKLLRDLIGLGKPGEKRSVTSHEGEVAMKYARMAVMQLKGIHHSHHDREEAFDHVEEWLFQHR